MSSVGASNIEKALSSLREDRKVRTKGPLSVMLHITRLALEKGLPIDADKIKTGSEGQLKGIGKSRIQGILKDHGIKRVLAEEGGRTSRGSLELARTYSKLLNRLNDIERVDVEAIEKWWIARVKEYFAKQPFKLKYDTKLSLRRAFKELLDQAELRQKQNPGTQYSGAVLHHLVGAKLSLLFPNEKIPARSFSTADAPSAASVDFVVGEMVIHVTTAPSEALLRKCQSNLSAGVRPIIVTTQARVSAVDTQAKVVELEENRVEVFEAEQFIASNVYEHGAFQAAKCKASVKSLIEKYNEIVEEAETDPSLRIELGG